jgi:tetratricopeptide (TPR) repeat protein
MKRLIGLISLLSLAALSTPALAQGGDFGKVMVPVDNCESRYGKDSAECVKSLSLYRESFKNWSSSKNVQYLEDAVVHWRMVFNGCPCASKNTYLDGEKILTYYIENEKDSIVIGKYVDTLVMLYDRRVEVFGQPCFVAGRKGTSLMSYAPERFEEAYKVLKMAFECTDEESSPRTIYEYFRSTIAMVENGKLDTTEIINVYDAVSDICQVGIDKGDKNSINYRLTFEEIEKAFLPYAPCEVLVPWADKKVKSNSENADILRKIVKVLDKKECTENRTYREAAELLYKLAPDSTSAMALGKMKLGLKQYSDAIIYLKDAAAAFKTPRTLDKIYLMMADAYMKMNNSVEARNMALKALEYNPNNGYAYLLIGDLYSASAPDCKWKEIFPAYWAAADAYNQAKAVDPSIADAANSRFASMRSRFPKKSELFFHNLTLGDSFQVGCWINRSTTVRSSD